MKIQTTNDAIDWEFKQLYQTLWVNFTHISDKEDYNNDNNDNL